MDSLLGICQKSQSSHANLMGNGRCLGKSIRGFTDLQQWVMLELAGGLMEPMATSKNGSVCQTGKKCNLPSQGAWHFPLPHLMLSPFPWPLSYLVQSLSLSHHASRFLIGFCTSRLQTATRIILRKAS